MTTTFRQFDRCAKSALIVATFSLVGVAPAFAQEGETAATEGETAEQAEARTRFKRGVSLYENGDYRAALIEFRKAYEIAPNYRVLYNIGQASYELKDYADALGHFESYQREGGAELSPERQEAVVKWIEQLKGLVGELTVRVNADDAEITVDNKVVGTAPLDGPVRVSAGRRMVSVSKEGFAPVQRYIDVAGAESATLELKLVPLSMSQDAEPAPSAPSTEPPKEEDSDPAPWVALAFTGGFAVATGVSAAFALKAKGDNDEALEQLPGDEQEIRDTERNLQNLAITTDVLGAATILAAGLTVVLFVVADDEPAAADSAQLRWRVGPTGLGFDGTF